MKCLRCGYCCVMHDVIIVKPEYVDCDIDLTNYEYLSSHPFIFKLKRGMTKCPYLVIEGNKCTCKIHDKKWYKDTPCYSHNLIYYVPICMVGELIQSGKSKFKLEDFIDGD